MRFLEQIKFIQEQTNSLLCIGLDPDINKIPRSFKKSEFPLLEFNKQIISATADIACGYKLNLAFYEVLGKNGWELLEKTLRLIPRDLIRIADGKRNDIGNSAEKYAEALLVNMDFDAVTVNPLMGGDSVAPFLKNPEKGAFILTLTSNPGSKDLQLLNINGKKLYEKIVAKAKKWDDKKNIGLVVGATRSQYLREIRRTVPEMPILLPGVGVQGGDLQKSVRDGCSKNGDMLIINIGRGIIYPQAESKEFIDRVRSNAANFKEQINLVRENMKQQISLFK